MKILTLLLPVIATLPALAVPVVVENANFEKGAADGWTLSGGAGQLVTDAKNHAVAVTGSGGDSNYWRTGTLDFGASQTYRLRFRARGYAASGGTPTSGPSFANRDLGGLGDDWRTITTYFTTPRNISPENAWLRFGQWQVKGQIAFDDVDLLPAPPVYARSGAIELGDGESISANDYSCRAPLGGEQGNTSSALLSHNCNFNSDRWVFGAGSEVIYKHAIAGRKQTAAQIEVGVTWYSGGQLAVDASRDGQNWTPLGTQDKLGTLKLTIPAALLPAAAIFIRLRAEAKAKVGANSDPGSFQVGSYQFHSTFDGAPLNLGGATRFFAIEKESPNLRVKILDGGDGLPGGRNEVTLEVERPQNGPRDIAVGFSASLQNPPTVGLGSMGWNPHTLVVGKQIIVLPYSLQETGDIRGNLSIWMNDNSRLRLFEASTMWNVPELYATNFGEKLPSNTDKNGLWWCNSGWKISRTRHSPTKYGVALKIAAARNESEAAQFVVRPASGLKNLTINAPKLVGTGGATIDAANVEVLRVRYVDIAQPTDATGTTAPWPDPLPPLKAPINLAPSTNQPFWVRVRVPKNAKPGLYQGAIRLKADGYAATVPLQLTVWNFALPDQMTCEAAFGFDPGNVFRYQHLESEADKRRVLDLYFRNYGAHHISPYNPAPLDSFKVTWQGGGEWEGGRRVTENPHGGAQCLLVSDESKTQQASARYGDGFAVPKAGVKLSLWYRAAVGHPFIVTTSYFDDLNRHLAGNNNDMRLTGNGGWQHFETAITRFPPAATKMQFMLWATIWEDDGAPTGQVFYDDVSLINLDTGKELVADGDFEKSGIAPRPLFDWTAWDTAMKKALNDYHFTSFSVPIQGLGGGTFESRTEPELLGFRENTPEYQSALKAYLQGVEAHLKEKGWLDRAFVYWFDEPDPKDYAFVMNGFSKLKNYAPGLRRMLTEQPDKDLIGGPNLWCPISPEFKQYVADMRMKAGDKFWWYVCTGPKAPYATEFIDHPGTELRVWLWQTWQRGIGGVLVWETTYWTSSAAYPDALQNPYRDPMSWVSGYSTKPGVKQAWGNGDGRFIYPPEDYEKTSAPILSGPVDSIRWEQLRDGLEDYEYLATLRRLLNTKKLPAARRASLEKLLAVPESITKDATTFTRDPAPMELRRAEIAAAIESLEK